MKMRHTISGVSLELEEVREKAKSIGLVPTMGALHDGHMALVREAREDCDYIVVSIFVNPTQFGPSEDFEEYPRTLDEDAEKCRQAGVELIFAPSASEMYPPGFDSWVEVGGLTNVLEGASRPGHFRGVATVCAKLFNIIGPDLAFFGTKDYQQLKVIHKMVRDLNMQVRIVPIETVREPDGLARSSRNAFLSPDERKAALVLSRSLLAAREAYDNGERMAHAIQALTESLIKAEQLADIDYVAVVDADTLQPIDRLDHPAVVLLAVKIGATRLIDNILLK